MAARFEATTQAARQILRIVRTEGFAESVRINPDQDEDIQDRIHVVLPDGGLSETAIYCGPEGYHIEKDAEVLGQGPVWNSEDMVALFIDTVRSEMSYGQSCGMR
jgi:hypothetical protein